MKNKYVVIFSLCVAAILNACSLSRTSTTTKDSPPFSGDGVEEEPRDTTAETADTGEPAEQNEHEALQIFCNGVYLADVQNAPTRAEAAVHFANYVEAKVTNDVIRKLFAAISGLDPDERESILDEALERNGIESCASLKLLRAENDSD